MCKSVVFDDESAVLCIRGIDICADNLHTEQGKFGSEGQENVANNRGGHICDCSCAFCDFDRFAIRSARSD